jgi:UDP-2,3-diacylglucosamine pyrophosphatase LpxH
MISAAPARYRTVWLSDVHLGTRACRVEMLLNFLAGVECDYLYLVGDIIDLWSLERRWHWPEAHADAARKLLNPCEGGTKVVYIPGNHDQSLRAYVGQTFGCVEMRREAVHTTADGRKVLMLHGDEFDDTLTDNETMVAIGDWFYDALLFLGRGYDQLRRKFGWPYFSPATWAKRRVKTVVSFVHAFHQNLTHYARRRSADVVVTGHIHRPEIRPMGDLTFINCGDWVENCTAIVEHPDGRLDLLHIGRDGMPTASPVAAHAA